MKNVKLYKGGYIYFAPQLQKKKKKKGFEKDGDGERKERRKRNLTVPEFPRRTCLGWLSGMGYREILCSIWVTDLVVLLRVVCLFAVSWKGLLNIIGKAFSEHSMVFPLVERCSEKKCKYFYWEVIYLKKAFSYKRPCCNFRTEAWDRTLEGSDMKIC